MITSKNIKLRAVEPSDIDLLFEWENNSSIWHLSNTLCPFSRFDLEQYILNTSKDIYSVKQLRLMIDLVESDKTIGSIDLFDFEPLHRRAGIGILINDQERNKGYASEAIGLLLEYASKTLNLHQLYCNIEENNIISLNLFKKKEFTEIGIKKDWNLRNGLWINEYILQYIFND
jgi:diamine N-acetyltransferase